MKNKLTYSILLLFFFCFSTFYFWYGYTKYVPQKVIEVGKTFIANESIRHILKVSILNEKGYTKYLLALKQKDEDLLYDSLDFMEASLGFLQSYELSNKRVSLIKEKVYESIDLIEKEKFDIKISELNKITENINHINLIVEEIEKNKWHSLHKLIVEDETKKFQTMVSLTYLILFTLLLLILILFIWYKKTLLEKEKIKNHKLLLNQSKVAAVGEMLGNIAHQWRQPLSVITTLVSAMKFSAEYENEIKKEKVIEYSDNVLKQSNYLSKTIDDFRSFFMSSSENIELLNIKNTYEKLEDLTESLFKNNFIKRVTKIDENIEIYSNESILIQSFINICNNTKDVFVEKDLDTSFRYFFTNISKENDMLIIKLKDSGGGIKKELLNKIFDPYFTTKDKSLGTGIGLYMTHQIITKHFKGDIFVSNEKYIYDNKTLEGAVFTIKLPFNCFNK